MSKTIAEHIQEPEVISYPTTQGHLREVRLIRTVNPADYRIVGIDVTGRKEDSLESSLVPGEAVALGRLHIDSHDYCLQECVHKWIIQLPPSDWFLVEQTRTPEVFSIILISSNLSDANHGPMIITGNLFDNSSGGVDEIIRQLNDWHGVDTAHIVRWIKNVVIATELMSARSPSYRRLNDFLSGKCIDEHLAREYSIDMSHVMKDDVSNTPSLTSDLKYFIATWLDRHPGIFIFPRPKYHRYNIAYGRMRVKSDGVDHQLQAATWKLLASARDFNTRELAHKANGLAAVALDYRRVSDCTLAKIILEKRLAGSVLLPWLIRNLEMIHDDSDEFPRDALRRELHPDE